VVEEAGDRATSIRSIEQYFDLRRKTVGARPSFAMMEYDVDFPDGVLDHPSIEKLTLCAVDLIWIDNDLYSYNVE
jgi:hypothetical protein